MAIPFPLQRFPAAIERALDLHDPSWRRRGQTVPTPVVAQELRFALERRDGVSQDWIDRLEPSELHVLLTILPELSEKLRARALGVLAARPGPSMGPGIWSLLQQWPHNPDLARLARAAAVPGGWDGLLSPTLALAVDRGLSSGDLPVALVEWLDATRRSLSEAWGDPANRLDSGTPLVEEVFRRILTHGRAAQIVREDRDAVFYGFGRLLDRDGKRRFARRYLEALPPASWDDRFLEGFVKEFGTRSSGDLSFWLSVPAVLEMQVRGERLVRALEAWPEPGVKAFWAARPGAVLAFLSPRGRASLVLDLGTLLVALVPPPQAGTPGATLVFPESCRSRFQGPQFVTDAGDFVAPGHLLEVPHQEGWEPVLDSCLSRHGIRGNP